MSAEIYQPTAGRAREALTKTAPPTANKEWFSPVSQRQRRIARPSI